MAARDHFDAVVVGCGPVGAFLALLLTQQRSADGLRVLLVEREPRDFVFHAPRAVALDDATVRLLGLHEARGGVASASDQADLATLSEANLLRCPIDLRNKAPTKEGGFSVVGPDPPFLNEESGYHDTCFFHQPTLEELLRQTLFSRPPETVTTLFGSRFLSYRKTEDGHLRVTLQDERNGRKDVACRWLIGCDGGASAVRKAAGIAFEGRSFADQPWLVVDCTTQDPAILSQWQSFNFIADPERPFVHVPLPGKEGGRRFEFLLNPGEDGDAISKDRGAIAALLEKHAGVNIDAITVLRVTLYTFHDREASDWWKLVDDSDDNATTTRATSSGAAVILAGDACHCMPPFRGQGLCAGLRDAASLFWRLATIKAFPQPQLTQLLLSSYQSERREHLRSVVRVAVTMGALITVRNPFLAAARDLVFTSLYRFPLSAPFFKKPFAPPTRLDGGFFRFLSARRIREGLTSEPCEVLARLARQACVGTPLPNFLVKGFESDESNTSNTGAGRLEELRMDRWLERIAPSAASFSSPSCPQWTLLFAPHCALDASLKASVETLLQDLLLQQQGKKKGKHGRKLFGGLPFPLALPSLRIVQLYPGSGAINLAQADYRRHRSSNSSSGGDSSVVSCFPLLDSRSLFSLFLSEHQADCVLVRPDRFIFGAYSLSELALSVRDEDDSLSPLNNKERGETVGALRHRLSPFAAIWLRLLAHCCLRPLLVSSLGAAVVALLTFAAIMQG